MAITKTWEVNTLQRELSDGYVNKVIYRVKGTDGTYETRATGEVDLETLVVFEHCLGYADNLDRVIKDPIWKDTKKRIKKYEPFLDIDCRKYKTVILETIKVKL